jgi:hypothetical protein
VSSAPLARLRSLAVAPPADRPLARFIHGLVQLPYGLDLVARTPDLRRRAILPALVIAAIATLAAILAAERYGAYDGARTFLVTVIGIASMPPILFANSFSRLAAATRDHLGLGPRLPCPRRLPELLRETIAQALLLAVGIVPLVVLASLLGDVGDLLALLLGGAWTLHWIVVEALDSARTRPAGEPLPEPPPNTPWYARMYDRAARGPLAALRAFARFVARLGGRWDPEVALIEARPWTAAGFAVGAAVMLAIPGLNLLFRPVVVAAAAHLLGRLEASPPPPPHDIRPAPGP